MTTGEVDRARSNYLFTDDHHLKLEICRLVQGIFNEQTLPCGYQETCNRGMK